MTETIRATSHNDLIAKPVEGTYVEGYLAPADAVKLTKRLRGVTWFVRTGVQLIVGEPDAEGKYRCFDLEPSLRVSVAQADKVILELGDFMERRIANGEELDGRVRLSRHGDCIFIG